MDRPERDARGAFGTEGLGRESYENISGCQSSPCSDTEPV